MTRGRQIHIPRRLPGTEERIFISLLQSTHFQGDICALNEAQVRPCFASLTLRQPALQFFRSGLAFIPPLAVSFLGEAVRLREWHGPDGPR